MTDKKKNKPSVKKLSVKKEKPIIQSEEEIPYVVGGGFTRSLGEDRSLQAYKDWINGMFLSINPNAKKDDMTETEWVKSWKEFWSEVDSTADDEDTNETSHIGASESKKTKVLTWDDRYPGITEQLRQFEEAELPPCPHCGSGDTASVQVGIIGQTMQLAASTKKFKLVPNMVDKLGKYFCNECKKFFD